MNLNIIPEGILEKYNCEMDGLERIYHLSFEHKDFSLRYTTPIYFEIGGFVSKKTKWIDVIADFVKYLSINCNLLKFKPKWCSGSYLFTAVSIKKSWEIIINEHLFFNSSQALNHLYLFIKDIVEFTELSLTSLTIKYKAMPIAEPKGIRDIMISKMKSYYRMLLEQNLNKIEFINEKLIYLHAVNRRISEYIKTGYDNVYLITKKETLQGVITRFMNELKTNYIVKEEQLMKIENSLFDYYDFFCFFIKAIKSKTGRKCFELE